MPVTPGLPRRFAEQMGRLLGPDFPAEIGLAVSGGGDSMALLHLAAGWARVYGVRLRVATVDHGLRAASAAEAALVADEAKVLGVPHDTLRWEGWRGEGNLQDAARAARRRLLGQWRGTCAHVLMAHTRDDQAETLLMRLARGSGVDGLAAMAPVSPVASAEGTWHIVRPLLDESRDDLRHYLRTLRIPFADDPSNDDPRYARVRMRHLIGQEGLDTQTLAATARHMARARRVLTRVAADAARALLIDDPAAPGALVFARDGFAACEDETRLRLLAAALQWISGADYRPRLAPLEETADRVASGGTATLHGCILVPRRDRLYIAREAKAVADNAVPASNGAVWDGRWQITGQDLDGLTLRALGEAGLAALPLEVNAPRASLTGLPALWRDGTLHGCPPLGTGPACRVTLLRPPADFADHVLTH